MINDHEVIDKFELDTLLAKDLRKLALALNKSEIQVIVKNYYDLQEQRKRTANQVRAIVDESGVEPEFLAWMQKQFAKLEKFTAKVLDYWTGESELGKWCRSITGIGPIIAAGLMAHIDIERCPTVGHIWRFAGLDPTIVWEKGQKRPFNANLKVLCWKIGESFIKNQNRDGCFYGMVFAKRKQYEIERNEAGGNAEAAAAVLAKKRIGKGTEAYKWYSQGKLPPAHIHARARRYAVKLFLSHYHEMAYIERYGKRPPYPYPIGIMGHADIIPADSRSIKAQYRPAFLNNL